MSDRAAPGRTGMLAVAAGLALAGVASAASPTERVLLRPVGIGSVRGSVVVGANGAGTRGSVELRGLRPGAAVRVLIQAGTCRRHGASFALLAAGTADAVGIFRRTGVARFHGAPVGYGIVGDGGHVITVAADGRAAACGVIPGID